MNMLTIMKKIFFLPKKLKIFCKVTKERSLVGTATFDDIFFSLMKIIKR